MAVISRLPQNYLVYSSQFDNALWAKTGTVVTPNSIADPRGGNDADTITDSGVGAFNVVSQNLGSDGSSLYMTGSVFLREGTTTRCDIILLRPAVVVFAECTYEWVAGVLTVQNLATGVDAGVVDAGGGWYRAHVVTIVKDPMLDATRIQYALRPTEGGVVQAGFIYAWGAQVNDGWGVDPIVETNEVPRTGI